MKFNSIRFKFFSLIVGAFFCSTVVILLLADSQLTKIIDTSKDAVYHEKVDSIWSLLHQHHERLKKTGLIEAYLPDFQTDTLKEIKQTYYRKKNPSIYPFIIDNEGNIVLHPTFETNIAEPAAHAILEKILATDQGDFKLSFRGKPKHYTFRRFPEWQWVVVYAVPLEIKYAEAKTFHTLLVLIMAGVTLLVLLLLFPLITRLTKPIVRLTSAAQAMSSGDLDTPILVRGNDEMGVLAQSFQDMRTATKQTICKLEQENRERKKAETALAHEKEQLAVTLISIGDGVISTDREGRILLMNKVAEELTGWSSSECIGRELEDIFSVIDQQTGIPCLNSVQRILASGTTAGETRQVILVHRDGGKIIIASNGAPIKDAKQKTIGVILVFRDITKQVETEQKLQKSRKLESIGVLAGGIAHDFNNILAIILGNINLSLMDTSLPEKVRKQLSNVEATTLRAQRLTQQLLTFSKGGDPIKKLASLENLIREAAELALYGRNVSCHYDIAADLWPAEIDTGQISQVIQNIIINGCEAMDDGGNIVLSCCNTQGDESVNAFLDNGQKYIAISIKDNGKGIPSEAIDKIFDPYFSTKTGGNGLGLAICHSIISKHNGYINVDSCQGAGTTFTLYLPACAPLNESQAASLHNGLTSTSARVMIMDDEELVRDMVAIMLEEMGHRPVTASHGAEAVELYKKNQQEKTPIDMVIMDLTIPGGMGGEEAVRELLAFDPNAKVIVCSGYSNDPVMADPQKYGFRAAIVKPYTFKGLSDIVETTLKTV